MSVLVKKPRKDTGNISLSLDEYVDIHSGNISTLIVVNPITKSPICVAITQQMIDDFTFFEGRNYGIMPYKYNLDRKRK
jgi:hypothetical protein